MTERLYKSYSKSQNCAVRPNYAISNRSAWQTHISRGRSTTTKKLIKNLKKIFSTTMCRLCFSRVSIFRL